MNAPDFSICQRVISSRWMLPILHCTDSPRRFGDIQARLDGLSRGVLAAQLRELLEMALLRQTRYDGFPPRVEYQLTPKGRSLVAILDQLPAALEPEGAYTGS